MGFNLEQAFVLCRSKRQVIRPKLNFLNQLAEFEKNHIDAAKRSKWVTVERGKQKINFPEFIVENFMEDYETYFDDEEY